jgi:hypothetical protein
MHKMIALGSMVRLKSTIRARHSKDILGINDDRFDLHTQAP